MLFRSVDHVVTEPDGGAKIDFSVRRIDGATYIFAVECEGKAGKAEFHVKGVGDETVEVIGEERKTMTEDGMFGDSFKPWAVHLYKIAAKR